MDLRYLLTKGSFVKNLENSDEYKAVVKRKKTLIVGHIHRERRGKNWRALDSAGYRGKFYYLNGNLIIADMHLGVNKTEKNISDIIVKELMREKYKKVIFLGDTFDLVFMKDKDLLMDTTGFFSWLLNTKKDVIILIGNHDINLENSDIYQVLQKRNITISTIYEDNKYLYLHGHIYDATYRRFGIFYKILFRILDYLNLPIEFLNKITSRIWGRRND